MCLARIWIVEDDPKIGLLMEMTLKKDGHDTLHLPDAAALESALKKQASPPHLMLLDLMLRAESGFDVLKKWKAELRTRDIPVIIVSARGAEQDKVRGLELGAEDYITKPFGLRELQARVLTALRRLPQEEDRLCFGALSLIPALREAYIGESRVELTPHEYALLLYLARRAGSAVPRAELLREVWGSVMEGDPSRTVDSHIKTLRSKLGDTAEEPRFIQTVRGLGYRLIAGEGA